MFGSVPLYFVIAIIAGIGVVGIFVGFCSCWLCKQCYLCYERKNEARQRRRRKRRHQQQQYEYDVDDEYDEFDGNIYYSKQNINDNPRQQRPRLESHAEPRSLTKDGEGVFPSHSNDRHHIEDERGPTRSKTRQAGADRNTSVARRSTCAERHSPHNNDNDENAEKGCTFLCTYCCCCCDSLDDEYYYDSDDEESEDDENPKERGTAAKRGHAVATVFQHTSSCDENINKDISNDKNRETSNEKPKTQLGPANAKVPKSKEMKAKKSEEHQNREPNNKEMKEKNKGEKRNKGNSCCAGCIIPSDSDDIEDSDYEEEWDYDDDDEEIRRCPNNLDNKNGIVPPTAGIQKRVKSVLGRPKSNKHFIDKKQNDNKTPTGKDTSSNQVVCCCFGYESDDEHFYDSDDEYSEEEIYDSDSLKSPDNKGAIAIIGTNTAERTEGKRGRKVAKIPRPRSGQRNTSRKSKDNEKCKACFLCKIKCIGCEACCKKKQMREEEEESNYDSDDEDFYDSDDDEDAANNYTVTAAGRAAASVTGVHASKLGKARVNGSKRKAKSKNDQNIIKKKRSCCFVMKRSEKNRKQNTKNAIKISKKGKVKKITANQNKTDSINKPNETIEVPDENTTKPPILVAAALEAKPEQSNHERNDEKINNTLVSSTTNNRMSNENRTITNVQAGAISGTQITQNQGTRTNQNVTEINLPMETKAVESYMDAKYGTTKPKVTFAEYASRGQSDQNQSIFGKNYDGSSNITKAKIPVPVLLTKKTAEKRNAAVSALFASSNTAVETSKVTGVNISANGITKYEERLSNANGGRSDDASSDVPLDSKKTREERKTERKAKKKEKNIAVMALLSGSLFPKSNSSSLPSQTTSNDGQSLNQQNVNNNQHQTTGTSGAPTAVIPVSLHKDRNTSNNIRTDGLAEPERYTSSYPNESPHNTVSNGGAVSNTNGYNPTHIGDNQSTFHHSSGSENNGMQTTTPSTIDSQHADRKPEHILDSNQNQSGYNQPIRNDSSYHSAGVIALTAMTASTAINQTNEINTGKDSYPIAANQNKPPTIPVNSDGIPPEEVGMKARGRKNWKAAAALAVSKEYTMPNLKADWNVTGGNLNKGIGQDKREPKSKFAASVSAMMAKQHFTKAREPRKNEPTWDLLEGKPKDMQTKEIIPKTTMRKSKSLNTLFENETDIFSIDLPTKRRRKRQEDFDWDAISSMASERGLNRPPRFNQPSVLMDDSNPIANTRFQGGPSRRTSLTNIRQ